MAALQQRLYWYTIVQLIASASAQPLGPKQMLLLPMMAPQMRAAVALQSRVISSIDSPKYARARALAHTRTHPPIHTTPTPARARRREEQQSGSVYLHAFVV